MEVNVVLNLLQIRGRTLPRKRMWLLLNGNQGGHRALFCWYQKQNNCIPIPTEVNWFCSTGAKGIYSSWDFLQEDTASGVYFLSINTMAATHCIKKWGIAFPTPDIELNVSFTCTQNHGWYDKGWNYYNHASSCNTEVGSIREVLSYIHSGICLWLQAHRCGSWMGKIECFI